MNDFGTALTIIDDEDAELNGGITIDETCLSSTLVPDITSTDAISGPIIEKSSTLKDSFVLLLPPVATLKVAEGNWE
jgi:hypothetical protein